MRKFRKKSVFLGALLLLGFSAAAWAFDMHEEYPGLCSFVPSFCDYVNCRTGGPCP